MNESELADLNELTVDLLSKSSTVLEEIRHQRGKDGQDLGEVRRQFADLQEIMMELELILEGGQDGP